RAQTGFAVVVEEPAVPHGRGVEADDRARGVRAEPVRDQIAEPGDVGEILRGPEIAIETEIDRRGGRQAVQARARRLRIHDRDGVRDGEIAGERIVVALEDDAQAVVRPGYLRIDR